VQPWFVPPVSIARFEAQAFRAARQGGSANRKHLPGGHSQHAPTTVKCNGLTAHTTIAAGYRRSHLPGGWLSAARQPRPHRPPCLAAYARASAYYTGRAPHRPARPKHLHSESPQTAILISFQQSHAAAFCGLLRQGM
jgi:hypothetical protein